MKHTAAPALVAALTLTLASSGEARPKPPPPKVKIGATSQQISPATARVRAKVTVSVTKPAPPARPAVPARPPAPKPASAKAAPAKRAPAKPRPTPPALPTLRSDSPLLARKQPLGRGTTWYKGPGGSDCIYIPEATPLCYLRVAPPAPPPRRPPPPPRTIATTLAEQLDLTAGRIAASPPPAAAGLTGEASWFWLAPPPSSRQLSVTLSGQRVLVVAAPDSVSWRFGDGVTISAGAGVAYRPGAAPAAAVRHRYETRCLAGDRGRQMRLPSGCRAHGYQVEATVHWRIHYTASGRVSASGSLPARLTTATLAYPVSEARAFLSERP